jgi:hypothetical protein
MQGRVSQRSVNEGQVEAEASDDDDYKGMTMRGEV